MEGVPAQKETIAYQQKQLRHRSPFCPGFPSMPDRKHVHPRHASCYVSVCLCFFSLPFLSPSLFFSLSPSVCRVPCLGVALPLLISVSLNMPISLPGRLHNLYHPTCSFLMHLQRLQVLEPALNDMEDENDFPYSDEISSCSSNGVASDTESERDGRVDSCGGSASATSRSNTENNAKKISGNCSESLPENLPENRSESHGSENRSRERLAWRCVQAARSASRLLPRLTAHALLPAAALRLPHSCAPAVRVPAGDRRSYNAGGGGGGVVSGAPTAGAAGWPLTVAAVALRDLAAGEALSCSWVDPEDPFSVRIARLEEYTRVPPCPSDDDDNDDVPAVGDCAASCCPLEGGVDGGGGGGCCRGSKETGVSGRRDEGTLASLRSPGGRGCGCPKCLVESGGLDGGGSEGVSGAGAAERLLKAAQQAVDEDR